MKLAVLIIIHKQQPESNEITSLDRCFKILINRKIFFVYPAGLDLDFYKKRYPTAAYHQVSTASLSTYHQFNQLKMSLRLYLPFWRYNYILFYEPDAYIFRDDLDMWMQKGYAYIGAPWYDVFGAAPSNSFKGIGNGGFSLRRLSAHVRVLLSFTHVQSKQHIQNDLAKLPGPKWQRLLRGIKRHLFNNSFFLLRNYSGNEDHFWALVQKKFSWFSVPDEKTALRFSIEIYPGDLSAQLSGELPTGCHAWWKYDLLTWQKYILQDQE